MGSYHITLADDHVLLRQGLRRIIEESSDLDVVGEVSNGVELLSLLICITTQMVILDISMPNVQGIEAVGEIKALYPKVKVLMLTMHREKEYLYQALESGADGYLLKGDADTELFSAIQTIRQGSFYVSPALLKDLAEYRQRTSRCGAGVSFEGDCLTPREREVLKLTAEGKSSRESAELLSISARTVDHHRANILAKLKINNTADLVRYAIKNGYTDLGRRHGTQSGDLCRSFVG